MDRRSPRPRHRADADSPPTTFYRCKLWNEATTCGCRLGLLHATPTGVTASLRSLAAKTRPASMPRENTARRGSLLLPSGSSTAIPNSRISTRTNRSSTARRAPTSTGSRTPLNTPQPRLVTTTLTRCPATISGAAGRIISLWKLGSLRASSWRSGLVVLRCERTVSRSAHRGEYYRLHECGRALNSPQFRLSHVPARMSSTVATVTASGAWLAIPPSSVTSVALSSWAAARYAASK
jgi:hypothetical protein